MTFTMKDYKNFCEEEKRQEQIQKKLQSKSEMEKSESDENWQEYLKEKAELEFLRTHDAYGNPLESDSYDF